MIDIACARFCGRFLRSVRLVGCKPLILLALGSALGLRPVPPHTPPKRARAWNARRLSNKRLTASLVRGV